MDFEPTPQTRELIERFRRLRSRGARTERERDPGAPSFSISAAARRAAREGPALRPLGAQSPSGARWHGTRPGRPRSRLRGSRGVSVRPLRLRLPGAGRRQYRDSPRARHGEPEGGLSRAHRAGSNAELLRDDRARAPGLEPGAARDDRRAGWRRIRPQRPQVVHHRRRRRRDRGGDGGDRAPTRRRTDAPA